jgi:hypothetical protein
VRNVAVVALLAAEAANNAAGAQRVHGTVADSATVEKIAGAVVTLTDSAGAFLSRSVADAEGNFSVMRMAGTRRLRAVRIGYRPIEITIGTDTLINLKMAAVPSVLGIVESSDRRVCPGDASGGLDLWEQARAGLLASVVSREANPPHLRLRITERTFEPVRRWKEGDSSYVKDVTGDRSFVAARPAWAFAESGYLRELRGGDREYFAPDEDVLVDPSFAGTHCLHVIDGRGPRSEEVGIAFEPVKDAGRDTLVDITGVVWLARKGLMLHSIEFHYTNLEREARDAGGYVFFAVMPTGVPMIERWIIRSPVLAYDEEQTLNGVRRRPLPRPERTNVRVLAYRETSGQVGFASWPDGKSWHAFLPRVVGRVEDLVGRPVNGAVVWLRDTPDTVRTGVDGRFEMPYVFPGIFAVYASDTVLSPEGIARTVPLRFGLFDAGDNVAVLRFYPRADVYELICPAKSYRAGTGVLLAHIVDVRGNPASNASVDVETRDLLVAGDTLARPRHGHGQAGEDGRFVVCGITRDLPILVRASKGKESAVVTVDHWREDFAALTIRLEPQRP